MGLKALWCGSQITFGDLTFQHLLLLCFYNLYMFMHLCNFVTIVFGLGFMCLASEVHHFESPKMWYNLFVQILDLFGCIGFSSCVLHGICSSKCQEYGEIFTCVLVAQNGAFVVVIHSYINLWGILCTLECEWWEGTKNKQIVKGGGAYHCDKGPPPPPPPLFLISLLVQEEEECNSSNNQKRCHHHHHC
jgi:hypothetical protein